MAQKGSKVSRLAVKEMVEGWEGRILPKNISMKTLIDMIADEEDFTEVEEREEAIENDYRSLEGNQGFRLVRR